MNSPMLPPIQPRPYRMQNAIQDYEWGTRDRQAYIPQLLGFEAKPGQPYAELWIGAHPKAPSQIEVEGRLVPLDQWIEAFPQEILGPAVLRRFGPRLPFLLKVLSAGEALSIQAHPNKQEAAELHTRDPQHYPDDNHKPEIAVALNSLAALVGVRPVAELHQALETYPEITNFLGKEKASLLQSQFSSGEAKPEEFSRRMFTTLLRRSVTNPDELSEAIDRLAMRLSVQKSTRSEREDMFLELRQKYPGPDIGLFFLFLLNLVHLTEGQAIYTHAGIPHAYLKGNIIECMANSDNVVRVGLTTKFKDAPTLVKILDYEPSPAQILEPAPSTTTQPGGARSKPGLEEVQYKTSSDEFQVTRLRMNLGLEENRATGNQIQILLAIRGHIQIYWDASIGKGEIDLLPGQSVLLPAWLQQFHWKATQQAEIFLAQLPEN
jgi:mannose-6-phosphate isomerase